tara:strand:- start:101 stop:214 length:114 start_codon:yes stop_codon:yes gene_type:complete
MPISRAKNLVIKTQKQLKSLAQYMEISGEVGRAKTKT